MILESYFSILNQTVAIALGRPIAEVTYRTYTETTPQSAVEEGAGWMHGEVRLQFEGAPALFLGWGENEGFEDHFSLYPALSSTYQPNTLVDLQALGAPEWRRLREQPLVGAELRGSNGTPHVLVLQFATGAVAIGDGYDKEFGDGDQILVHALPDQQLAEFGEIFWRVSAG